MGDPAWIRNIDEEARQAWDLGKALGMGFHRGDDEVVRKLAELERRDMELALPSSSVGAGGINGVNQ